MEAVSTLGTAAGILPLMAFVSILAWRFDRRHVMAIPVIMLGAGGLQLLTKWAIDRPRPNSAPWGFPSGHVLSLVVLLGLASYLFIVSPVKMRWRYLATSVCAITVFAVALSRLYLNAHWLSDVMGGFAVGLAYLLVVISILEFSPGLIRVAGRVEPGGPENLAAPHADAGLIPVTVSIAPRTSTLPRADD